MTNNDTETEEIMPEAGLSHEHIHEIREALAEQNKAKIAKLTQLLHASDTAELLGLISRSEREQLLRALGDDFDPETLTYLDEEISEDIIDVLGAQKVAEALTELETDDAVQVIEDLEAEDQRELLEAIGDAGTRAELSEGLAYPEESAGRLMQKRFVAVPEFWSIGDVIDFLRQSKDELPDDFYEIIVVDPRYHPIGSIMTSRLIQSQRSTKISELMREDIHSIPIDMDQEEVAYIFRRYGLVEAPVVNPEGRIVGVITIDDIVDVIKEEEEEDYLRAGGVIDRDIHAGLLDTVSRRLPWLVVNLLTAAMAAWVISQFESVIERWVTLAVLMPVIASMSGNAGIQSVTISVRAIATRELQSHNAWPVIRKEMLTNMLNSLVLSLIMSVAVIVIYQDIRLAGILSVATVGTLTGAGLVGAFIPLLLNKLKIDPAIASGVLLTTITDMLSFFMFLGLASLLIL